MPPDPLRKNELFSERRRTDEHQFFITTGWKERFAQLDTPCAAGARSTSFHPAVPPEEVYLKQSFSLIRSRTSVQRLLIWCPNTHPWYGRL